MLLASPQTSCTPPSRFPATIATAVVECGRACAGSGGEETLGVLQDPARRLPQPCARPCLHTLWVSSPHTVVSCQRTWRRAQTGNHERALACHLRAFLDDEDSGLLHVVGERVVQPVPLRPALPKHAGGVRALVVGDLLRRLVGKVLAQSFAPQLGQDGETLRTSTMFALSHIVVMPDDNPGNCALRMRTCLWEASACYQLQHIEHPVVRHTSRAALAGAAGLSLIPF